MEKYIQQLLEDLHAARKWAPKKKQYDLIEELEEIDRIIDEKSDKPMHNIFGIDPDILPPVDKLTEEQAALVSDHILKLWAHFKIEAVYPKKFPLSKLYPLLVKKFRKPFLYFPMGITGVEFCSYDPDKCPFGEEYCTCKDYII